MQIQNNPIQQIIQLTQNYQHQSNLAQTQFSKHRLMGVENKKGDKKVTVQKHEL